VALAINVAKESLRLSHGATDELKSLVG